MSSFTAPARTTAWLNLILFILLIMSKFEAYIGRRLSGILSFQANFLSTNTCRSNLIAAVIGVKFPAMSNIYATSDTLCLLVSFSGVLLIVPCGFLPHIFFEKLMSLLFKDSLSFLGIHFGNHFIAPLMLTSSSVIFLILIFLYLKRSQTLQFVLLCLYLPFH